MAGKIVINELVLGDHATPANNFVIKTNADGTAALKRNADGSGGDILTVDAAGRVTASISKTYTMTGYTGADIALNINDIAIYDVSSVGSMLLRLATSTDQIYELYWTISGTTAGSSNTWWLETNNTTYTNFVSQGQYFINITSGVVTGSAVTTQTRFQLGINTVGANYHFIAKVFTKTNSKQVISECRGSQASTGFIGNVAGISNDSTTVWSSLGTINFGGDTVSGRLVVRRVS